MIFKVNLIENFKEVTYPGVRKGRYLVGSRRTVYSLLLGRNLTPTMNKQDGYYRIGLAFDDGEHRKVLLHRVIAWEFCSGRSEERKFVNHKDTRRYNNFHKNLEWCTPKENIVHASKLGLVTYGEDKNSNVFPESIVERICTLLQYKYSPRAIFDDIEIWAYEYTDKRKAIYDLIRCIRKRRSWNHISKNYNF